MTLEEFKLKEYRSLYRDLSAHKKRMMAYRATANPISLGFLDALEQLHEDQLIKLNTRIRMLKPRKEGEETHFITPSDIARAKLVPISTFLKVQSSKKVNCLFHADKNASMHIYPNSYYCFSCQAHGTTIDVVMKLRGCSFTQAVRFLINK